MNIFSKLILVIVLGWSFNLNAGSPERSTVSCESLSCKSVTFAALLWALICCAECNTPCLQHQARPSLNNKSPKNPSDVKMS